MYLQRFLLFYIQIGLLEKTVHGLLSEQNTNLKLNNKRSEQQPSVKSEKRNRNNDQDRRILEMFGFKKIPSPGKNVHIPKLMQHLYKSHMGDYFDGPEYFADVWEVGFDLPPDDVTTRVNTARSYHHIDGDENLPGLSDNQIRLRFNITSLPENEVIEASDLLLHRKAVQSHITSDHGKLHRINIYQIIKILKSFVDSDSNQSSKNKNFRVDNSGIITRLIDTRLVDTRNSSWERFDVSLAVLDWVHKSHEENHGLLVEVLSNEKDLDLLEDDQKHVRLKRDLHQELDDREWQDKRPTLVNYTKDSNKTDLKRRSRSKRNSRKKETNSSKKKRKRKKKNRPCARHDLYVDFREVGWQEWIVAPHGYEAFYCHGQCSFPLAEHLNATNHAIVQTLTNSVRPSWVPSPCCVPTELTSISMLYLDEHDQVVLKSYPKMAVEACGCR